MTTEPLSLAKYLASSRAEFARYDMKNIVQKLIIAKAYKLLKSRQIIEVK
jgi:hypothetical protein